MNYNVVLYQTRDRVAVITLNRPDKLNAWTSQMASEMAHAVRQANEDDAVGALVFTGAGRAFCAGADVIEEFKRHADAQDAGVDPGGSAAGSISDLLALEEFLHFGKPSIAAINGYALGIGLTFPLNCDIRIAAENARLNTMFLRVGLIPEFGSSYLLPRIVGLGKACELIYMPRMFDAREALEIGLVNRVAPTDKLLDEALAMATTIAKGPAFALKKAKEVIYRNLDSDYDESLKREAISFAECMATAEHREGIRAFVERREPDFQKRD